MTTTERLTKAQITALRMLAESPRATTRNTEHVYIGGQVAKALIMRGLAKRVGVKWGAAIVPNAWEIHITLQGLETLKEYAQ